MKKFVFFILTVFSVSFLNAQTKIYKMHLNGFFYESLKLFENGNYEKTSEYDIVLTTKGTYKIIANKLLLFEGSDLSKNIIDNNSKAKYEYFIEGNILIIDKNGRKKHRIKDKSLSKGLSNYFGHKYEYKLENP